MMAIYRESHPHAYKLGQMANRKDNVERWSPLSKSSASMSKSPLPMSSSSSSSQFSSCHHCFVQVPNGPTDVCRLHRFLCGKTDHHSLESEIFVLFLFWFRIVTIIMFFLRFHFLLGDVFLLQEIKGFRCFPLRFPTQTDVSHLDRCFPLRCEHLNTCVSYSDR